MANGLDEEASRLTALRALGILDTAPEPLYDDIVRLAAIICDMPIAIINFVDADRQWGKALVGLQSSEAPRDASFCARTIQQEDGMLIVADTHNDAVWADNPQVTGEPGIRFYAGAAIVTAEGHALGSVCVADCRAPRSMDARQIDALRMLARQTASLLRLRQQTRELGRLNEQLQEMAVKDSLTGVANRTFFEEALSLALRQRRIGRPGVLFCDLDSFKLVNDRLGHHAGDRLLQITAQRMGEAARAGDLVARLAGDEFVVLCPGIRTAAELDAVARRIADAVSQPARLEDNGVTPRISVGSALADEGDDPVSLLRRADLAMYRSKPDRSATGDRPRPGCEPGL